MRSQRKIQVTKRPDDRSPNWYLRYWEPDPRTGKLRERWVSTSTTVRKVAEQRRRELEQRLGATENPPARGVSWDEFAATYNRLQLSRKPPTTAHAYRSSLETFAAVAQPQELAAVTVASIEDFADQRLRQGLAPATVNRDLRHLKASMRWAARRGMIDAAPDFHGVFVREVRTPPTTVPEEHFLAMVRATETPTTPFVRRSGEWWRTFLYVSYYLGLRRGETLALTWEDVRLENRELRVKAPTSKGRKDRVLPLSEGLLQVLTDWRTACSPANSQQLVLAWPLDTMGPFYDEWRTLLAAADLPDSVHYTPKDFRSTCASALIASNVPTVVVKDFLGHASVATTVSYYINTEPALRAIAEVRPVKFSSAEGESE